MNEILLIGNAVVSKSFAYLVDNFQDVVRMNRFRTRGYAHLVGEKTTIIAANSFLYWKDVEPGSYREIWMNNRQASKHMPRRGIRRLIMQDFLFWKLYGDLGAKVNFDKTPISLGCTTFLYAVSHGYLPTLVNFDWAESGHYFDNGTMWPGHPWKAEREMALKLESNGRLNIIRSEDL